MEEERELMRLRSRATNGIVRFNLPLLFADGNPKSLEELTMNQLEKFIPFMTRCSSLHQGQEVTVPKWWPAGVSFSFNLKKPTHLNNACWLAVLKSLVCRCYTYHGCEWLLKLCSHLSTIPSTQLSYKSGCNGTTSLYNNHSGRLLVTFRNEVRSYDKKPAFPSTPLLPRNQCPKSDSGAELATLQYAKECEMCSIEEPNMGTSYASPEDLLPNNQQVFLKYFGLKPLHMEEEPKTQNNPIEQGVHNRRFPLGARFTRAIAFSSPLGVAVHRRHRKAAINTQALLNCMERYCNGKILKRSLRVNERFQNKD